MKSVLKKLAWVLLFVFISTTCLSGCFSRNAKFVRDSVDNERPKSETISRDIKKSIENQSVNDVAIKNNVSSSYEQNRKEFASIVKKGLNAPGLPPMCTDVYFNSEGELIIIVNGEWLLLEEELRKDMIYALTQQLRKFKEDLDVDGFGQFFSDSGRPLESFYAN